MIIQLDINVRIGRKGNWAVPSCVNSSAVLGVHGHIKDACAKPHGNNTLNTAEEHDQNKPPRMPARVLHMEEFAAYARTYGIRVRERSLSLHCCVQLFKVRLR